MKKFAIAVLAFICMACLGLAAACSTKYYNLTIDVPEGVTVVCEARDGAKVPKGYNLTFTLEIDDKAEGEAEVKANDKTLTPDNSGVYSFKMNEDTTLSVTGITYAGATTVTFDTNNNDFVGFLDLDGKPLTTLDVSNGDTVQFKTHISPYYQDFDISVVAGTRVLEAVDGVYSLTVTGSVTVSFKDVPADLASQSFLGREGGGYGTAGNPFVLKTPLDLYVLAYMVGDGYDGGSGYYHTAYYVLDNDIDMRGEKLFVIGDGRTNNSMFAGVFDGRGHTISNYYMNDLVIDQTTFQPVKLTCVGLFGYATAANDSPSGIYNLNLKDFTIEADGASINTSLSVGGLIGVSVGITVSNCTVNGKLTVDSNSTYFGYIGGIVGFQQSFYSESEGVRYLSVVQSSSSNVTIMGTSGYILAAGGISGYVYSDEESSTAAILNCYSDSDISGAMRAGGIAGMINSFSSVKNCYSYGYIESYSALPLTPGLEAYSHSYAGGLVGFADYNSIISDSYSTAECSADSVVANYSAADGVLGGKDAKADIYLHAEVALVYNCYSTKDTVYGKTSSVNDNFLKTTLLWDEQDWQFNGDGKPTAEQGEAHKTFKITVVSSNYAGTNLEVTDMYFPMSYWYLTENGLSQYLSDGSMRTFGYYFDSELTEKVPLGYIPTHNITLYTKYVDYSEVAGKYYIAGGEGTYFTLDEDGYIIYRDGAVNCVSTYYYNGEIIVLENTFFAILLNEDIGFYTYVAELDGGIMKIYANPDPYSYQDASGSVVTVDNYTKANPLTATPELESFNYGSYYSADGTSYTFRPDGTGLIEKNSTINFTYVLNGNEITVSHSGTTVVCKVENKNVVSFGEAPLTAYDAFRGEWEKASSAHKQYTFDGKGNWTYEYYGYDKDGNKTQKQTSSGTYTVTGGVLSFDGCDKKAKIENGLVYIDGEQYGTVNSFAGTWIYNTSDYTLELTLNGVGTDGYGKGAISCTGSSELLDINYEIIETRNGLAVAIYYYYEGYGLLTFDATQGTLSGSIYVASKGDIVSGIRLCMYDDLRGLWNGHDGNLDGAEIRFNGFGNYNFDGYGNMMAVRGNVYVNNTLVGTYALDQFTLTGSFTYNGKTYEIEYDDETGVINVSCDDGTSSTLTQVTA